MLQIFTRRIRRKMSDSRMRWNRLCRATRIAPLKGVTRSGAGVGLYRINDGVGDHLAVVDAQPLREPQPARGADHDVQIAPDVEHRARSVQLGAEHGVVRLAMQSALGVDLAHHRRAHHVALVVGIVEQRFLDAVNTVAQHGLAVEGQRGQREAALEVLARLQLVNAVGGEEAGPQVPLAAVHGARVVCVQGVQRLEGGEVHGGCSLAHGAASTGDGTASTSASITLRQYSYMPRISVSVTMWSVSPASRPPSSARVRCCGLLSKASWEISITSPSSALTKPAGPKRLAWRSRRCVISWLSSSKPKWV